MMESSDGTNACSVTYNPDKKLYYCFIAGNNDYPLEVFDIKGKNVYTGTIGMDARGLWYNPKYKQLEGTCYNNGYFSIPLTVEGFTQEPVYVNESVKFAGEQSVASFSPANGEIYHFYDGKIHIYSRKKFKLKSSVVLSGLPCSLDEMNYTTMIYTGYKNYEFGFLDIVSKKIHLVNKSGKYSTSIELPASAVTPDAFRFSYANDKVFLYNVDTRTWTGYTVFY